MSIHRGGRLKMRPVVNHAGRHRRLPVAGDGPGLSDASRERLETGPAGDVVSEEISDRVMGYPDESEPEGSALPSAPGEGWEGEPGPEPCRVCLMYYCRCDPPMESWSDLHRDRVAALDQLTPAQLLDVAIFVAGHAPQATDMALQALTLDARR